MKKKGKYPEGYFIGICTALGIPFGIALAISIGNPGFMGIGIPIGLAIGLALEEKYKSEGRIRLSTKAEKMRKKIALILGIILLILGALLFFGFLLR